MACATEQHGPASEASFGEESSAHSHGLPPSAGRASRIQQAAGISATAYGPNGRRGDLSAILGKCRWFRGLGPDALRDVVAAGRELEVPKLDSVFRAGDTSDDVYVILSGRVTICSTGANGRDIGFREYTNGDCFGELAAIDGRGRSATARALTSCRLYRFSSAEFRRILASYPQVADEVQKSLAGLIRSLSDRIADNTARAGVRIVAELVRMAESQRATRDSTRVSLYPAPTDEDLAARLDSQREAVNRVINELKRRGLISRSRSSLVVLDLPALHRHLVDLRR